MKITVTNRIIVKDASPELRSWVRNNLIVSNPTYDTLMRIGKEDQIRRKHIQPKLELFTAIGNELRLPFGCLRAIWPIIKDSEVVVETNQDRWIPCRYEEPAYPPFGYQEEAIQKMLEAKSGILIGGCGSGKTNCGIEIIRRIGKNALWLCHTKDLLKQTEKRIRSLYPNMPIGTITDGKINMVGNGITIATVQTMAMLDRDEYASCFNTVVVDEAHHISGSPTLFKQFVKVISQIPARHKYGLTATEERNDSMTLSMYAYTGCDMFGQFLPVWKIKKEDTKTLTAKHVKVDLDTPFCYDMLNSDGTFNYANLVDYLAKNEGRNLRIIDKVCECRKEGRKQLVLASRIEQCELLHQKLIERGIKSVLLVGKVSAKRREAILTEQEEWEVIVATLSLAKEGLDVTCLDTLHLACIVGNKSDAVQSAGRIERVCEGKKVPIVYDYVDIRIPYVSAKYRKRAGWLRRR